MLRAQGGVKGWMDVTRGQNGPGASQSLPELHRHGGVGHPRPQQPTALHPVLGLVQEADKADARTILAEYVGHLGQHRGHEEVLMRDP